MEQYTITFNKPQIDINIQYGSYTWCYGGQGYVLTENDEKSYMAKIDIQSDINLLNITYSIFIETEKGSVLQYNVEKLTPNITFCFPIDKNMLGKNCIVKYNRHNTNIQKTNVLLSFKPKFETIYSEKIQIPELNINELNDCSICLDNIKNEDKYITACKHSFHNKCIWKYLKTNNLLQTKEELENIANKRFSSHESCEHNEIFTEFFCPMCRTKISK